MQSPIHNWTQCGLLGEAMTKEEDPKRPSIVATHHGGRGVGAAVGGTAIRTCRRAAGGRAPSRVRPRPRTTSGDQPAWGSPDGRGAVSGASSISTCAPAAPLIRLPSPQRSGLPLLLLHGNPQNHICWHKIAAKLLRRSISHPAGPARPTATARCPRPDRRTSTSASAPSARHVPVMTALGLSALLSRGPRPRPRTAHRMCLDEGDRVTRRRLPLMDMVPTFHVWNNTTKNWAIGSWALVVHGAAQAFPERSDQRVAGRGSFSRAADGDPRRHGLGLPPTQTALDEYIRCYTYKTITGPAATSAPRRPATMRSIRPTRTKADPDAVLILVGALLSTAEHQRIRRSVWKRYAANVVGHRRAMQCGHYIAEEMPDHVYKIGSSSCLSKRGRHRNALSTTSSRAFEAMRLEEQPTMVRGTRLPHSRAASLTHREARKST